MPATSLAQLIEHSGRATSNLGTLISRPYRFLVTKRRKPALSTFSPEEFPTYKSDDAALRRLSEIANGTSLGKKGRAVMAIALDLQHKHNTEDEEWLRELGIDEKYVPLVLLRLVQRGGCWLEFVQEVTGVSGDLGEL